MSRQLKNQRADQARYAAAWEASDHPRPRDGRLTVLKKLGRRRSLRILFAAPLAGLAAGAWWYYRKSR